DGRGGVWGGRQAGLGGPPRRGVTGAGRGHGRAFAAERGAPPAGLGHRRSLVHLTRPGAARADRLREPGRRLRAPGQAAVRGRQGPGGQRRRGARSGTPPGGRRRGGRGGRRPGAWRGRGGGEPAARPFRQRGVLPLAAPGRAAAARGPARGGRRGGTTWKRTVLVVAHPGRPEAVRNARLVVGRLTAAGINVRVLAPEAAGLQCAGADVVPAEPAAAADAEM